ncbi:MAG: histidine kinase [Clostridia bacterium]|nr:histidine kinase [Clostridia bacterium]
MKSQWMRKFHPAALVTAAMLILCVLALVLIHTNSESPRRAASVSPFYVLKPDQVTEAPAPDSSGTCYVYTFTLPDLPASGLSGLHLTAFLHHTWASFFVDGSSFTFTSGPEGNASIGKTPGKYWLSIPMRPEFSGKTVRLVLTPVFGRLQAEELEFMLISRDTLLTQIVLPRDGFLLLLGCMAVMAGLILAVIILFIPVDRREKQLVFTVGLTTVLAALWKISGLPVITLLFDYLTFNKEIWYAGTFCYLLMLVFTLCMMSLLRNEQQRRPTYVCFILSAAAVIVFTALQIAGVMELHDIVIWFGIAVALTHLVLLLCRKAPLSEWMWALPFFLTMGADLLIYLLTGSMQAAPFFLIWLILRLFFHGFGFARKAVLRERMLRKKEEELHEERVRSMINQIQPHFIYNTLSSIYLLCRENPDQAARVVEDFSTYLQGNFTAIASAELTAFTNELQHTRAYLAVETVLYGDSLVVVYDTDYVAFRLPPLTLQPLVENAVKYGVAKGHTPGKIIITSRAVEGGAEVTVEDNGPGFTPAGDDAAHVGLQNVRERLAFMCGGTLEIGSRPGGGTVAWIRIPASRAPESLTD